MEQQIMLLAFLILGIAAGVVVTWLIFRNRIEMAKTQAKNESQVENARLNERLLAIQEENIRHQQLINEREQQINVLRNQFIDAQNQRTQLEERASRVSLLEQELEKYKNGMTGFRALYTTKIIHSDSQSYFENHSSGLLWVNPDHIRWA